MYIYLLNVELTYINPPKMFHSLLVLVLDVLPQFLKEETMPIMQSVSYSVCS